MFNLNRYDLFKNIDFNTPDDVIVKILSTCGKIVTTNILSNRRQEIIDFIRNYKNEISLEKGIDDTDYQKLATYVSSLKIDWKKENIKKCFQHLLKFYNNIDRLKINDLDPLGDKDNVKYDSFDIIMLYSFGIKRNISFDQTDTFFDIYRKIKDSEINIREPSPPPIREPSPPPIREPSPPPIREPSPPPIREPSPPPIREPSPISEIDRDKVISRITLNLRNESDETLYKINKLINESINFKFEDFDKEDLEKVKDKISLYYLISKSCLTNLESIVYAAKFYSMDLSMSSNPAIEFLELNSSKLDERKYNPIVDDEFSKVYNRNSNFFSMDKFWRKKIKILYPQKTLNSLTHYEGGDDEEKSEEFLHHQYSSNNFYQGFVPFCNETSTYIKQININELDKNSIISFGNMEDKKFIYLTPDEISDFFEKENDFIDFIESNNSINMNSVTKLINICKEFPHVTSYYRLINIINEIKTDGKIKCPIIESLLEKYLFHSDSLDRLFVGLYEISETILKNEDYKSLNEKIIYKINNYNDNSLKNTLKTIPLIKYNKRFFILKNFKNINVVIDLLERLEQEENIKEYAEILKITSYYYYHILSGKKLFNI